MSANVLIMRANVMRHVTGVKTPALGVGRRITLRITRPKAARQVAKFLHKAGRGFWVAVNSLVGPVPAPC